MINLEEEATIIAHSVDKPFDFALKRRLIATIISARATLLRHSITSNRQIPSECIQVFALPIEKAESFSLYYIDNYKTSVRTKVKVPTPIRINSPEPFVSVSSLDGSINFSFADIGTVRSHSKGGKFVSKTGRYIYHGHHVGAYSNEAALLSMPMLLFRGIIENPLEVRDYANHYVYDEEHFPMPMDMAITIRDMIRKGDLSILPESQTIPINDNKS